GEEALLPDSDGLKITALAMTTRKPSPPLDLRLSLKTIVHYPLLIRPPDCFVLPVSPGRIENVHRRATHHQGGVLRVKTCKIAGQG
ncbi:MAG: hypothetical protein LBH35_10780, partial [Treponema sp.]|nr:hypothetical protein [Treponema sp.]